MNIKISHLKERQSDLHETVQRLAKAFPEEHVLQKRLDNYQEFFDDAVGYLSNPQQKLAFIGNVGTGKTTAICHLLGFLDGNGPILSTGGGRTTLCEVEICAGPQLEIEVTPHSAAEIKSYLRDFAQYLYSDDAASTGPEAFKLSSEIERALRNMLDLKVSRTKNAEGKRIKTDNAKAFAEVHQSIEALVDSFWARLDISNRQKTLFVVDAGTNPKEWLRAMFRALNSCMHPNVSLSKRIQIRLPTKQLSSSGYALSVVDTKGVDQTVNRVDLDSCLTDSRTISVLCSRFNEAPDKTIIGLLKLAKAAGLSHKISQEVVLLILDRGEEAAQVIDVDEPVGDKDEGREIRAEQVANDIKRTLQIEDIDIVFFDAQVDDPRLIKRRLGQKIAGLRARQARELDNIERDVKSIEAEMSSQASAKAKEQLANVLRPWIDKSKRCSPAVNEYFLSLMDEIQDKKTYASSVRASVNRKGEWHNFDYYQLLATGAREQIVAQIDALRSELVVLIDNMLAQPIFQPAYALLEQLKQVTDKRLNDIYQKAFMEGRAVYQESLSSDSQLWDNLSSEWGKGPGYKNRISDGSEAWFYDQQYTEHEGQITVQLLKSWNDYLREIEAILGLD